MGYLEDFKTKIDRNDYTGFLKLWEEYCYNDEPNADELIKILKLAKDSEVEKNFGQHVNRALLVASEIEIPEKKHKLYKLIFDIQNINTPELAEYAYNYLKEKYSQDKYFDKKVRLIGLAEGNDFQHAITGFDLLSHLNVGKFVFHTAGWGTGEVLDISLIREEATFEFDFVVGHKSLSFKNALKTLIALPDDHFLSMRFGNPDSLEQKAKEDPLFAIRTLLKDLGPKTASEIKDEICDLVIPSKDWSKWWQLARAKIKKDTKIQAPKSSKNTFVLLEKEISHEESFYKKLETKPSINEVIQLVYSFLKNFPETLKNQEFIISLQEKLKETLNDTQLTIEQKIQLAFLLEDVSTNKKEKPSIDILKDQQSIEKIIDAIDIVSLKKRVLITLKRANSNWENIFISLFLSIEPNMIKDYILNELLKAGKETLIIEKIKNSTEKPLLYPTFIAWYFQKIINEKSRKKLPFSDEKETNKLFECFLILLDHLGQKRESYEMAKKMAGLITDDKFNVVRKIMKTATIEDAKEYILLSTKCRILSDHEIKIIRSLAEVVFPSLKSSKTEEKEDENIIWTTEKGYKEIQEKVQQLATVETVKNAKEIEEARALGDLRENSEYKFALEKRSQIQAQLKLLTDQLNTATILTKQDVIPNCVGVGTIIECKDNKGNKNTITILGPWDANVDENILSFQSKVAKTMNGKKLNDKFKYQDKEYTIVSITNYFDKK
jgi:transcription elongation factor GreA-like protein/transcription elongation GreA/GreB family factor